jgi:hypothetical protein
MHGSTAVGGLLVLALLLWSPAPGQADMEMAVAEREAAGAAGLSR